jgi:hypothetical protein
MERLIIENKKQAKKIFNYCKTRLPKIVNFNLTVEQPTDGDVVLDGVRLKLAYGSKIISQWYGTDEDDALLCVYKDLVYYFKDLAEQKPIVKNALGRKHYS